MLTISNELLAAIQGDYTPYINLVFHDRDDNNTEDFSLVDDATNRIMDIQWHEKMYDGYGFIKLRNNDLAVPDLRGWWVEPGFGADTSDFGGSGVEYKKRARMWVTNQQKISAPGHHYVILILEDVWRRWARHRVITLGGVPYFEYAWNGLYDLLGEPTEGATETLFGILKWMIEINLAQDDPHGIGGARPYMAGTLDPLGDQDDNIINTKQPYFAINQNSVEPAVEIVQRALVYTHCFLRARSGINFEIRLPQDSDAVDATYYSDQVPYFHEWTESESVLVPNFFLFYGDLREDGTFGIVGWKSDIADNEEKVILTITYPYVNDVADLITYAQAYLQRIKNRRVAGRLVIRHDPRLEIHDKIEIWDTRGG